MKKIMNLLVVAAVVCSMALVSCKDNNKKTETTENKVLTVSEMSDEELYKEVEEIENKLDELSKKLISTSDENEIKKIVAEGDKLGERLDEIQAEVLNRY